MNMLFPKKFCATGPAVLGLALAASIALPAHAASIALVAGSGWSEFIVDNQVGPSFGSGWIDTFDGSPLQFEFTVASGSIGTLTVVDAGYAGDTPSVANFGAVLGQTTGVAAGTTAGALTFDFDAALADPSYSRGVFALAPGSYRIGGSLVQSVTDGGVALDATNGALQLNVAATVPEPDSLAMLLAGLGAIGFIARRRAP